MLRIEPLPRSRSRVGVRQSRLPLLFALAAAAVVLGPSIIEAAQLALTWVDNSGGQAAFNIERKTGTTGTYGQIGQQPAGASSYLDTAVTSGTTYCYRVQAFDSAGASGYSNEACASPAVAQLSLNWVDTSGGQAAFSIERKVGITGSYAQIAQQPPGVSTYADQTVGRGDTYCYRVQAFDSAGTSPYSNEACGSLAGGLNITVATAGTGTGTVTSSPGGISCGVTCAGSYPAGSVVTLTATPASGDNFTGWSGGCTGAGPCTLTGNTAVVATATFVVPVAPDPSLTVQRVGPGTVRSQPNGITCGKTCSAAYPSGTVVTLTAVPARGATFAGWSGGGCQGTDTCTVTLSSQLSVSAIFRFQNSAK